MASSKEQAEPRVPAGGAFNSQKPLGWPSLSVLVLERVGHSSTRRSHTGRCAWRVGRATRECQGFRVRKTFSVSDGSVRIV